MQSAKQGFALIISVMIGLPDPEFFEMPEYQVRTGEIMVKFSTLQSAKISESKSPNRQNGDLRTVQRKLKKVLFMASTI